MSGRSQKNRKDIVLIRIALIHDILYLLPDDRAFFEKYLIPGSVEENAGWVALRPELLRHVCIARNDRIADMELFGELRHSARTLPIHREAKHHQVIPGLAQSLKFRHFSQPGRAPCGPRIDKHPFALMTVQGMQAPLRIRQ